MLWAWILLPNRGGRKPVLRSSSSPPQLFCIMLKFSSAKPCPAAEQKPATWGDRLLWKVYVYTYIKYLGAVTTQELPQGTLSSVLYLWKSLSLWKAHVQLLIWTWIPVSRKLLLYLVCLRCGWGCIWDADDTDAAHLILWHVVWLLLFYTNWGREGTLGVLPAASRKFPSWIPTSINFVHVISWI